ncbi:Unknown protein sequence [Pseudomonas amygdali pv. aesculi]|nr:Unknown protein sequence [Pseudomonas amygdali pv. aesculi]
MCKLLRTVIIFFAQLSKLLSENINIFISGLSVWKVTFFARSADKIVGRSVVPFGEF